MSPLPGELVACVEAYLAEDPEAETRSELRALLDAGDEEALRERFDHPLTFGTAGLRAALGAGPARMNRAVVRRSTAGLAAWVGSHGEGARRAGVVVGHDARHRSADFASDAAAVASILGVDVHEFRRALPTPITVFAVRHLGAHAGVMVTASHNPAPDNGYKVYVSDGAEVIPPDDEAIAAAAAAAPVLSDAELAGPARARRGVIDEAELLAAYRSAALAVIDPCGPRALRAVYTPIHGVGGAVLPDLLVAAGFAPPIAVAAQAEPDPDFPTAPFPNPEEPGVLDLALAAAAEVDADLVIANDPDADRLAVALPDPSTGTLRVLSGDELGVLLADEILRRTDGDDRLVATTVVSSSMLRAVAADRGVAYVETLTGFKWIARAASRRPGHRLVFGYEEALGYAVSDAVHDKDGISAGLLVAAMAAAARAEGASLLERLDELEAALGVHATGQWSLRLSGADAGEKMADAVSRFRAEPPAAVAGLAVSEVRDLEHGEGELPPSDVVILELSGAGRVVLRPSGTEPKLKAYLEATTPPSGRAGLADARAEARRRLGAMRSAIADVLGSP